MYLQYWGMRTRPFDSNHMPRFFVPIESAALAQMKLRYVLGAELGAAALIGPAGVGKTELARVLLAELQAADWAAAYVVNPSGTADDVMTLSAGLLGAPRPTAQTQAMEVLLGQLGLLSEAGRRVCLVVDEVHTIRDVSILETFRMLLNVEREGRRVVNLLLVGQSDMDGLLEAASGFAGHLALRITLPPMGLEETKKYVLYRLKEAGCTRGIFTRHAADLVHEFSSGLPRNVNRICDLALLTGFGLQAKKVGPKIIQMAAQDLGLIPGPQDFSPPANAEVDILADIPTASG